VLIVLQKTKGFGTFNTRHLMPFGGEKIR